MSTGKAKKVVCSMMAAGVLLLPTAAPVSAAPKTKVEICHKPGTAAQGTRRVAQQAVKAHMAHGDSAGPCVAASPSPTV
ncbi:MAG TPA: hypothetical protein VHJ78_11225 [Actinomycetota bacterium]|nr:hypothetical protein [Actinomycetota bacterium]